VEKLTGDDLKVDWNEFSTLSFNHFVVKTFISSHTHTRTNTHARAKTYRKKLGPGFVHGLTSLAVYLFNACTAFFARRLAAATGGTDRAVGPFLNKK